MVAAINISDPSNLVLNFVKGFDNQNLWPGKPYYIHA